VVYLDIAVVVYQLLSHEIRSGRFAKIDDEAGSMQLVPLDVEYLDSVSSLAPKGVE
jgi:hypothetical protein